MLAGRLLLEPRRAWFLHVGIQHLRVGHQYFRHRLRYRNSHVSGEDDQPSADVPAVKIWDIGHLSPWVLVSFPSLL